MVNMEQSTSIMCYDLLVLTCYTISYTSYFGKMFWDRNTITKSFIVHASCKFSRAVYLLKSLLHLLFIIIKGHNNCQKMGICLNKLHYRNGTFANIIKW